MRRAIFILCLALFTLGPRTLAQTGFPAFGSFEQSGFDAVNRQNLNALFAIPIMSTPGRGQTFQYSLVNNSLLWNKTTVGSTTSWTSVTDPNGNPTWGWSFGPAVSSAGQVLITLISSHTCRYIDPNTGLPAFASYQTYAGYEYKDWIGTIHNFGLFVTVASANAQTYCGIVNTTFPISASDNTGFLMTLTSPGNGGASVQSPSGIGGGTTPLDPNGNFVSFTVVSSTENDWTDTAGHVALKVITNTSNPNIAYEWQDSSGGYTSATTTTAKISAVNIKTNFGCTGVNEYTGTANLPYEIDLPNGQKYLITYEGTPGNSGFYTGRVQRVTFPTGGYYEYDYTGSNDSVNCSDGTTMQMNRVMNDGANSSTWSFSRSGSATTVTAPVMPYDSAANNAVYTFSGTQQTTAQFYQGAAVSGNLKRTVSTTWATNGTPATQITMLEDGSTKNEVETSYDSNGNILTVKEHDWGTGTPGSILRTTTFTYLNTSPYITANILNRVTKVTVADSGGTLHSRTDVAYDESTYTNYGTCHTGVPQNTSSCTNTVRGNPTTVTTYSNAAAGTGAITHHSYYDNLGNLVKADLDCCQSKTWAYSSTTNYSFPDSATRGSSPGTQLTSSATYNAYTGLVATSTDENSQVTHYTFDNLKRITNLQRPDSTNLTWSYTDATPPTQSSVTAGAPIQGTNVQNTVTTVDGLGRPVTQKITDGTTTYSIVATQYDPLGRPYMGSNPYTSSALYWTTAQFDALGRATKSILQDTSATTFSYATNTATVMDPAGKTRKSVVDGLGRMTKVFEDPSALNYETDYAYNILDQLTGVTQGAQTRTYVYDDLGRLLKSTTPEAGALCFGSVTGTTCNADGYDSFGNLLKRTDARGVLTSYGYDNLNRLSTISYNVGTSGVPATPGVTFTYDQGGSAAFALGRLTKMADGVGSETYTYNLLGKMAQLQKLIGATTYQMSYAYNLAGELSTITYPSNRVVQQSFDTIGRLCAVGNSGSTCSSGTTYATGYSYNAAFHITGFNYGNGVAAAFGYTPDRLLLQSLAYTKGATTLFSTNYWYKTDSTNCPSGASGNNGQIQCITDNVDSGRTVTYAYDALYRVTAATTNGSSNYAKWGLQWTYDRYGNRLGQSQTYGAPPTNSVSVDAATNHITGTPYAYDANGNMTNDGNNTLVYDAENRVLSATNGGSSGSYSYDGNSLRVQKVSGGTTTIYIFAGSKVIAEYSGTTSPYPLAREYIYSGGALLAKIESGATKYYHQDQLSNRVVTDSSGTAVAQLGHYPFGESWYNASSDKLLFTSYERDSESGNDYAMMRSSVNRLARFSSPDLLTGTTGDPQSLNHYTYVLNDPANLIDPFGLDTINLFYCMETEDGPYLCIFSDDSGETTGLPLIKMGGHGGGGGWPSLPKFSKEAFDKCAKQAFGGTTGNIPGTDRSIPGYDAALTVFQASLLTGADPATVAGTMAYESNFNLYTATQFDPGTLSADVGPMQLNTANIGDHTFPYFPGAYGNAVVGQPFNGDVLANTLTGASYLNKLRNHPEKYAAPVYRQGRSANLQLTHPSLQAFFDCLAANAIP